MILYSIYYIQRNQAVFRSSQHQVLVPGFSLRNFALGKKSALLSSWAQPTELLRWPPEAARLAADIRLLPRSTWEVDPSVHLRRRPSRKFGKLGAFKNATFVFWSTPKKIKKKRLKAEGGWNESCGYFCSAKSEVVKNCRSSKSVHCTLSEQLAWRQAAHDLHQGRTDPHRAAGRHHHLSLAPPV